MKARVTVTLKPGVLDPQGKAIEGALRSLGVDAVMSVRQGKIFDVELDGADPETAEAALEAAATRLLANTVIEKYQIAIDDGDLGLPPVPRLPRAPGLEAFSPDEGAPALTPAEEAALDTAIPPEGHP